MRKLYRKVGSFPRNFFDEFYLDREGWIQEKIGTETTMFALNYKYLRKYNDFNDN